MTRTQLLTIILAVTIGWVASDLLKKSEKSVSVLPAANAQMLEDVSDLLKGRPGAVYLTVSDTGDKLIFWRFEEVKGGEIFPTLAKTQVFTAR